MKRITHSVALTLIPMLLAVITFLPIQARATGNEWVADSDDPLQRRAAQAIERFKADGPQVQRFFDEAYAYAVFPGAVRAGMGLALGYGNGVVIEQGRLVAQSKLLQMTYAVFFGGQWYRQIVFFRTKEAFETFKSGSLEFIGQAAVAFLHLGAAADPSFGKDVALVTQTRFGLEIELTPGMVYFTYRPISVDPPAPDASSTTAQE